MSKLLNGFPLHRHREFKIWKDYELFVDWHSNEEILVWVSFGILCNLGNQPTFRIQECLSLSLSSVEKKHCQAFYVNFCCAILFDFFFFKEGNTFFWFSRVFFRNIQVKKKNRWTSFSFPKNFEGTVIGNFTMHVLFFNQFFSKLVRKLSWEFLGKYTSTFPERLWVVDFYIGCLDSSVLQLQIINY